MACFLLLLSSSLPIEASEPVILSAAGAKDLLFDPESEADPSLRSGQALRFGQDDLSGRA